MKRHPETSSRDKKGVASSLHNNGVSLVTEAIVQKFCMYVPVFAYTISVCVCLFESCLHCSCMVYSCM